MNLQKPPCGAFYLILINRQFKFLLYNENNQLIAEYDNNNNVIAEYYYFGLRPVAVKTNGVLHIVHTDYLGTPRVITNSTSGGNIVWEWKNDNPYGNNKAEGSIEFNLRFAGQYYDYESNLHYNIYRTYNPEIGRYMQSDPIGLNGGFNTYNYVNKNPLDSVDPLGLRKYNFNDDVSNNSSYINEAYENDYAPDNYVQTYGHGVKDKDGEGFIVGMNSPAIQQLKNSNETLYAILNNVSVCTHSLCSKSSKLIDSNFFGQILFSLEMIQPIADKILLNQCYAYAIKDSNQIKKFFPTSLILGSPTPNYIGRINGKAYTLGSWTGYEKDFNTMKSSNPNSNENDIETTRSMQNSLLLLKGYSGYKEIR